MATSALPIFIVAMLTASGTGPDIGASAAVTYDELAEVLDAIEKAGADVKDLRADFRQVRYTPLLRKPLESGGTIRMTRDLLVWETREPEHSIMAVSDGEVRILYPDDKLLEVYAVDEEMGPVAATPLISVDELQESFTFELIDEEQIEIKGEDEDGTEGTRPDDATLIFLRLTPNREPLSKHLESLTLHVAKSDGFVRFAEIVNADGERTEITFTSIELNPGEDIVDATRHPPEGTTISRPGRDDEDLSVESGS